MTVAFGYADPAEQAAMLLDLTRNEAYTRAIRSVVGADDVVVDIGSGTGFLAIVAAQAGARRVFAIERTGMIELVRAHARENGVADVVVPIRTDLLELDALPERPTVVVGEQLGHFAPDEAQHHLYARARVLAAPGARFIPARYRLLVAAARPALYTRELTTLASAGGVSLGALGARLRHRVSLFRLDEDDLVGPETPGRWVDSDAPLPTAFSGTVVVEQPGPVTGISVAFEAELAPGVTLSTSPRAPRTHWHQTFFPIDPPLVVDAGASIDVEIRPRVVTDRGTYAWTVRHGNDVRRGDAMKSLVGDLEDTKAQLGLRVKDGDEHARVTVELAAWAAALGGGIEGDLDVDAMASRVRAALPDRFPDDSAALQEVRRLLRATGALGRR